MSAAVLEFAGTSKVYGGLRPLRIAELRVHAGDSVALLGFDQPTAEVFVNLATGATLPDAGEVSIFGLPTRAIEDSADWLATVDRFGIVSERAVLLDALTVIQNLAMPFTLEIEPPPDAVRLRAEALARDVGLPEASWARPACCASAPDVRSRSTRRSCCSSTPARGFPVRRLWPWAPSFAASRPGAASRCWRCPPTRRSPARWRRAC